MEVVQQTPKVKGNDVVWAKCDCCGLTEECTEEYARRVRDRYSGRWICGLCGEAVKDEILRSEETIGPEEALSQHMSFCGKFKTRSPPESPTEDLIAAVKHLLLRRLDSPRPSSMRKPAMARSHSCHPVLDSGCLKTN